MQLHLHALLLPGDVAAGVVLAAPLCPIDALLAHGVTDGLQKAPLAHLLTDGMVDTVLQGVNLIDASDLALVEGVCSHNIC